MKKAVLSLSGGMDSSSLLLHLLANGYEVTALGFDYGQKHKVELERATSLVQYLNGCSQKTEQDQLGTITVTGENFPLVNFQIIKLDGLSTLLNSALVTGGNDVPEGHYEQDNMKETVVPNRNKIFASLIQAVALSVATKGEKQQVAIAMGIHAGDHAIYPDCRQEFRDVDFEAFKVGNWDSELVYHYTPYLELNKFTILEDGQRSCDILGLDFNEVYKRTNTSYKPMIHTVRINDETSYEGWFSDYKSAASVERIEAFIKLGRPDPVAYADETGPVTWEVAKAHVEEVLAQHSK
jgi:7-cyano-7-deazaguanine synthase